MNSYGLGLILNFVDNASSGMRNATNVFNQMSGTADSLGKSVGSAYSSISQLATTGTVLTAIGDAASGVGTSIMKAYMGIGQSVVDMGGMFVGYERQLTALYKDADKAIEIVERMKEYAEQSVFEIDDLISSVTMMKVVGIEALDAVTSSSGETSQTLLDYASDIAAMMPNLRNIYGTGSAAAMGALKEYIAEGNAMTLKRSAGLDITGLLGEDKGKTIEERSRQIADLVEMLGIAGYTATLFGTPGQIISNLSDYWKNFMGVVAKEGGVYDNYARIITKLGDFVTSLVEDTGRYNALVEIVSNVVNNFLDLADRLLDKVLAIADAFTKWAAENPELANTILKVGMALGGVLVVFGLISKYAGSFFLLRASMMALRGSTVGILSAVGSTFFTTLLPMIGLAYLLKKAWDKNLWGIKDTVKTVFSTALITIKALFFGVRDESGRFADLSEEDFAKAKETGVLPFIEAMLELKLNVKNFIDGFKIGFDSVLTKIKEFGDKFFNTTESAGGVIAKFGEKLKSIFGYNTELDFAGAGEKVGKFAAKFLILGLFVKTLIGIFGFLSGSFKLIMSGVGFVSKGIGLLKSGFAALFSPIGLIIAAVVALVAGFVYFYNTNEDFKNKVIAVWNSIKESVENVVNLFKQSFENLKQQMEPVITKAKAVFDKLRPVFEAIFGIIVSVFVTLFAVVSGVINGIINALAPIIDAVLDVVNIVVETFSWLFALLRGDFESAAQHGANVWESFKSFFVNLWNGIVGFLVGLWDGIVAVFSAFGIDFNAIFTSIGNWIKNAFINAKNAVVTAWNAVIGFFKSVWDGIVSVFNAVVTWFSNLFSNAWSGVKTAWSSVSTFFQGIWDGIVAIFNSVITWFSNLFTNAKTGIETAWSTVVSFFQGIWDGIVAIFSSVIASVTSWFTGAQGAVEGAVGDVSAWASTAWTNITGFFSGAITSITGWFTGVATSVESVVGDVSAWASTAWANITGFFSDAVTSITGWFTGVATSVEGVVGDVSSWASTAWTNISTALSGAYTSVTGWFTGIGDAISTAVGDASAWATNAWNTVTTTLSGAVTAVTGWFTGVGTTISTAVGDAAEWATTAWATVTSTLSSAVTSVTNWFSGIGTSVTTAVGDAFSWASTAWTNISDSLSGAYASVTGWFTGIGTGVTNVVGDITSWATDAWTTITGVFSGAIDLGSGLIEGFKTGVSNTWESAKEAVSGFFGNIWSGIKGIFGIASPSTEAISAGENVTTSFQTGVKNKEESALSIIGSVFKGIWNGILNIFGLGGNNENSEAKSAGNGIVDGLVSGMSDEESLKSTVESIVSTVIDNLKTGLGVAEGGDSTITTEMGKSVVKGLNEGLKSITKDFFKTGASSVKTAIDEAVGDAFGTTASGFFGTGAKGATKFEEIGKNIAQGIAWGLENSKQTIKDAIKDVSGTTVLDSLVSEDVDVLSKWTELTTGISSATSKMQSDAETHVKGVITSINSLETDSKTPTDNFNSALATVGSKTSTVATNMSTAMSTLATSVISSLNRITNAFNGLTWKLPHIKTPTVSVSYSKDDKGLDIPKFSIIWNAKGGIFDSPTIFPTNRGYQGVGEAGAEAILPLSDLWNEMTTRMRTVFAEASTPVLIADNADLARSAQPSQTTNVSEGSKTEVHFAPGSFVVQLANGTQEELKKAAMELMKIIERQTEIKNLATRGRKA